MKKNHVFLLLLSIMFFAGKSFAQSVIPCYTDEMNRRYKIQHPEIATIEKQLEAETAEFIAKQRNPDNKVSKTTKTTWYNHADTDWYDIPVVVHILHDYSAEDIPDDAVYALIKQMNRFYALQTDTSAVIKPFKKYVGRAKFRFHLATIDPSGNPTNGITRRFTYLTYGGDDQAKVDQWNPSSYVNIWFENHIGALITGGVIVAYATPPGSAAAYPFTDGIICNYSFIGDSSNSGGKGGSIDHEMGHIFNLAHTFGGTNNPGTNKTGSCGDDDGVDDTPPTDGQLGGCWIGPLPGNKVDTVCSTNYYKMYTNIAGGDSLVNYPDTGDVQNIMNYADCKDHFTLGQVWRMRAALNSSVGGRSNLWDSTNLVNTGALVPKPDMLPIIDFSVKHITTNQFFTFPKVPLNFAGHCWNDTITALAWRFGNGATTPFDSSSTSITGTISNAFTAPGWVTLTMAATGNHSGTTTETFTHAAYVADTTAIDPAAPGGYFQEFSGSDTAKWPTFNYYNNGFMWQIDSTVGFDDHYCMKYIGYDYRLNPALGVYPINAPPAVYEMNTAGAYVENCGDYDDMFSTPVNLSSFSDTCNLDFFYSAASRTSNALDINDTLFIDYAYYTGASTMSGWTSLAKLNRSTLINKGATSLPYVPTSQADWAPQTIGIPPAARKNYIVFRFRYRPNMSAPDPVSGSYLSSGNNFYMDRVHFSRTPASVGSVKLNTMDIAVVPNPTNGNAYVVVKDVANTTAQIVVTDITGKSVYATTAQITSNEAQILIPHSAISVPGMYLVQVATGNQMTTKKLVVY